MKPIFLLAILCPLFSECSVHNHKPPYSVGDIFPSFTLKNVINHSSSSLRISPGSNTIYLLNFVSIACRSCARDYARLDALQKEYGKQVQVILITPEDEERVENFLKTNPLGKQLHLPVATSDTLLATWFPHRFLSHTVWLQNGMVKGITDPQYINENNIEILLSGHMPRWPVKNDTANYNASVPLLRLNRESMDGARPFYSVFTSSLNGFAPSFHRTTDSTTASVKTTILNQTIINCYLHAYHLPADFPLSQVVLNVEDSNRYFYHAKTGYQLSWDEENRFCYESVLPSSLLPEQEQHKFISDLDFYFGIRSAFREINAQCFALTPFQNKEAKPLFTHGNSPQYISISNLVWYINHHWYGIPAFDETGITGRRYIPFNEEVFSSYQTLQPYLKQYGLQLSFTEKQVDLLFLTENSKLY